MIGEIMRVNKGWFLVAALALANTAFADPERSYQGGKAIRDAAVGKDQRGVDDRDFEQRVGDYMKARGAGDKQGMQEAIKGRPGTEAKGSDAKKKAP
jgi:hypothetical protein